MDIRIPTLAEGVNDGTVVSILVSVGDKVEKDQPILELETEKAVAPIPSSAAGTVTKILVKDGEKVSVGQPVISLEGKPEAAGVKKQAPPTAPATPQAPITPTTSTQPLQGYQYQSPSGAPPPASPTVRRTARELGIDLRYVRGSEKGGRITLHDVRDYVQQLQAQAAQPQAGSTPAQPPKVSIDFSKWGSVTKKPLSAMRKTIGQRMYESWNTIPHVTQFDEADITDLLALRKKFLPAFEKKGVRLTITAFIIQAVVEVLKQLSIFNASLDESTDEIVFKDYYHLGIAVDTEAGLMVPVIRDVDKKNLLEISKDLTGLAEKARSRKVSLEDLKGGTFTISNLGGIGGQHFSPVINKPEAAILGLGRGVLKPVIRDKKTVARTMLPVCVSYDHRIIDGADGSRFISALVKAIENYEEKNLGV